MDIDLLSDFLSEAKDLLEATDEKLIALEKSPDDANLLNAVFRGYHTIKGSAGFLELVGLVKLCHALETLFDALRSRSIRMNASIMDASLDASNNIGRCLHTLTVNPDAHFIPPQALVDQLLSLARGEAADIYDHRDHGPCAKTDHAATPNMPAFYGSPPPGAYWAALHQSLANPSAPGWTDESTTEVIPTKKNEGRCNALPMSAEPVKNEKETQIKVDTHRLDSVLTLAGEIGLAKNRVGAAKSRILSKDFSDQALADLDRSFNDLDRLAGSLQNAVMLTRMQPIGRLFSRYSRIVRDLSRTLGKKIEIHISGQDTEIDKGMIDDLADPLVHLIRNSADHGIEMPLVRTRAGKPSTGRITLSAQQDGDRILIEITDDGNGIDPSFIRAKAKLKGILDQPTLDAMNDRQALAIIFMPGFSTVDALSSVSGRGVGMDVVKTNISKMGGDITIESAPGLGTTMAIRLPLTLAVLPALLLTTAGQSLALPLSLVQEILSLEEHPPQTAGGRPVINLRGEMLSVLDLSEILGWGPSSRAKVAALVDLGQGRRVALRAEAFIGRDEVVVKPLGGIKSKGVSGVMLDAQGDIVLILDLKELLGEHFGSGKDKMA